MSEERKIIEVGMAGLKIARAPHILLTRGLGSCLGITMYSPIKRIGALAHPMLPDLERTTIKTKPEKFVNSAIALMIEELEKMGCSTPLLKVKLFGGAHMFSAVPSDSLFNIGWKNVEKAKEVLDSLNIKIAAQEVGSNFGRTIALDLNTGKVKVKTIFHGEKEV